MLRYSHNKYIDSYIEILRKMYLSLCSAWKQFPAKKTDSSTKTLIIHLQNFWNTYFFNTFRRLSPKKLQTKYKCAKFIDEDNEVESQ